MARSEARAPGRQGIGLTAPFTYVALIAMAFVYIFPFLVQLSNSFKSDEEATSAGLALWSPSWTTAAYSTLFANSNFALWTMNSFIVTILVTLGRVFFVSLGGYALARLQFPGRTAIYALLIAVMAVPSVVLLIPKFLVIKSLGIYDSYPGMILPLLVDAAGVFIMKNFFESIPVAVEEAARIDGAGPFRTFWSIILPMARPALVTITILSFQGSWNELTHFIISTQSPELTTLTRGVASLASGQLSSGNQFPIKLAAATLMTIPVAIMFFIFQKRIMNASGGAVKE
jgi:multiple sugar transport system permease protein